MPKYDEDLLRAALIGMKHQRAQLDERMVEIEGLLNHGGTHANPATPTAARAKKRHRISAEGRARIAAAQRRRWATAKKEQARTAAG